MNSEMTSSRAYYQAPAATRNTAPGWRNTSSASNNDHSIGTMQLTSDTTTASEDLELQSARTMLGEKVKELSVALTKVDALTRQLEELKTGNTRNSYHISAVGPTNGAKYNQELEKLRQELLYRSKVANEQNSELVYKKSLISAKKNELNQIDQKIAELQERLARKRQLNQQLSSQMQSEVNRAYGFGHQLGRARLSVPKSQQIRSQSSIAAVEPIQRQQQNNHQPPPLIDNEQQIQKTSHNPSEEVFSNKQDPKYQTLPYNTKFAKHQQALASRTTKSGEKKATATVQQQQQAAPANKGGSEQCSGVISPTVTGVSDGSAPPDRPSPSGSSGSDSMVSVQQRPLTKPPRGILIDGGSGARGGNSRQPIGAYENTPTSATSGAKSNELPSRVNSAGLIIKLQPSATTFRDDSKTLCGVSPNVANSTELRGAVKPSPVSVNNVTPQRPHPSSAGSNNSSLTQRSSNQTANNTESIVFHLKGNNNVDQSKQRLPYGAATPVDSELNDDSLSSVGGARKSSTTTPTTADGTGNIDWQKVKRRPVVVNNDMEQELEAQMTLAFEAQSLRDHEDEVNGEQLSAASGASPFLDQKHQSRDSETTSGSPDSEASASGTTTLSDESDGNFQSRVEKVIVVEKEVPEVVVTVVAGNEQQLNSSRGAGDEVTTKTLSFSPVKRTKGNLKNQQQKAENPGEQGITRRVSFDPLALLLDAALEGELELVKKSASQVSNPSAVKDEGITALHNAICAGHYPIVQYLVEIGCDVNAQDSDGWTPLHCAASCNNLTMVKFLVEHGARIFATTFSDHETAAEKCEEDEEGFDGCSQYLYSVQENLGSLNGGVVYAVYDYEAQNADELNFKDGDRISIIRKSDEEEREWWWAKFRDAEGYVPRNLLGLFPRVKLQREEEVGDGDYQANQVSGST